jgi:hypothetical protein
MDRKRGTKIVIGLTVGGGILGAVGLVLAIAFGSNLYVLVIGLGMIGAALVMGLVARKIYLPNQPAWRQQLVEEQRARGLYVGPEGGYDELVTEKSSIALPAAQTDWYENKLVGTSMTDGKPVTKRVAQTSPRIGLDSEGVRLARAFGKETLIPWHELWGPSHESLGDFWNIYPSKKGKMDMFGYCVINETIAKAIATHPGWNRKGVTKGDVRTLGVLE